MNDEINKDLSDCLAALRAGGLIIYPTDTVGASVVMLLTAMLSGVYLN